MAPTLSIRNTVTLPYYEVAIGTTHRKCSSYKTQTTSVFQKASTSDPNATRIWTQELIFQRPVQCSGGCRYSLVQTPSAKVSFIL
jgi:hypothetical protein